MIGKIPVTEHEGRGTEFMARIVMDNFFDSLTNLHKYNWIVLPYLEDNITMYTPGIKNIIWLHVPAYGMPENIRRPLVDPLVRNNTAAYIVQSKFHKADLVSNFNIDPSKVFILNNTFSNVEYYERKKSDIVTFIYPTQISRGLDILLEAFSRIDDKNIRLIVHGVDCDCTSCLGSIPPKLLQDERISTFGFMPKSEYINNINQSHILAYPCTFQETAGIAIMEAMISGLHVITTDIGALKETTMGYAKIIEGMPIDESQQQMVKKAMVKKFTKEMKKAIKLVRNGKILDKRQQSQDIFNRFNIDTIKMQWQAFNDYM